MNAARMLAAALVVALLAIGLVLLAARPDGNRPIDAPQSPRHAHRAVPDDDHTTRDAPAEILAGQRTRRFDCSIEDFSATSAADDEDASAAEEKYGVLIEQLAASSDLERRLAAALLKTASDYPDAIDDLAALMVELPDHPLLHWHLLDACAVRPTHPLCRSGQAETRVIRYLGHNGEAWAKVAYHRLRQNDIEGGIEALSNASAAAEFGDYWSAEVELVFRALEGQDNAKIPSRLIESIGYVSAFPARYLRLTAACPLAAADSPTWFDVCIAYAERKEIDADSLLGRSIGIGLQRAVHAARGNADEAAAAEERNREHIDVLSDSTMRDGEVLLAADESVGLEWLQRLSVYGQLAANDYLRQEVERLSAMPSYNPCPAPPM